MFQLFGLHHFNGKNTVHKQDFHNSRVNLEQNTIPVLPLFTQGCSENLYVSEFSLWLRTLHIKVYLHVGEKSHGLCIIAEAIIIRYNCNFRG